jgi:hypothetical protein
MTRRTIEEQAREMARRALRDSRGDWHAELTPEQEYLSWTARHGVVPEDSSQSTFVAAFQSELDAGERGNAKPFCV